VGKTYAGSFIGRPQVQAVTDVTLTVEPGEVFGLLGPNRAGKTTLLKMLLTLCQPSTGEVRRLGKPAADRSTLSAVGYVHENHAFPRYLSAAGLLDLYGTLGRVPDATRRSRIPQLLDRFGLADRSAEPIARFSKGMLQRLGLAQALVNSPRLLVLDEPTEGLDLQGRQLLRDVVREVRQQGGSVLLVTHVVTEVEQLCDRIGVLKDGRLIHVGPLAELLRPPAGGDTPRSLERLLRDLYARPQP
jgi:ABC-2 type transport system ATP-binding protein